MGIIRDGVVSRTQSTGRDTAPPGPPMLELVVEPFQRSVVEGGLVRVGSHPSNDVVVDDPLVALFHCRIELSGGHWVVRDEGSRGGTVLDGVTVRDADLVVPTSHLTVGRTTIRVTVLGTPSPKRSAQ